MVVRDGREIERVMFGLVMQREREMDRVCVDVCREWGRRVEECIWVIWNEQSRW